jgi:exodeoxyribonuclease VIII
MKDLMIDFETLGLKENAVLLSLGACMFDPATGEVGETFYAAIDPRTQHHREIDASTVLWWLDQDEAARRKLTDAVKNTDLLPSLVFDTPEAAAHYDEVFNNAALPINHVAMAFIAYVEQFGDDVRCWSNGAVDHAWLNSMMTYCGLKNPIKVWNQRDYRTIKGMYPDIKLESYGVAHNALDDAIKQTKHLCAIFTAEAAAKKHAAELADLVYRGNGESNEALALAEVMDKPED